jgi:hypothetical protein
MDGMDVEALIGMVDERWKDGGGDSSLSFRFDSASTGEVKLRRGPGGSGMSRDVSITGGDEVCVAMAGTRRSYESM